MREYYIWAAGLFDGEGCVTMQKEHFIIALLLTMTDEATVKRFHTIFRVGSVCYLSQKGRNKAKWQFQATGKDAYAIVKLLRPFLFTKTRQADVALEWGEKCADFPRGKGARIPDDIAFYRRLLYDELRILNERGPK